MDAARRILARSSVRWSAGIVIAMLLGAFVFPLGCGQDRPPVVDQLPSGPPVVRVRLIANEPRVNLTASGQSKSVVVRTSGGDVRRLSFPLNSSVPVTATATGWLIGQTPIGAGTMTLEPEPEGTLSIESRPYRGSYVFVPVTTGAQVGKFDVINHLKVDDYLKGVLAAELYPDFHPEAYKAQAIAARTYAIYGARTTSKAKTYDLHSDVRSQMYGGIKSETPKSVAAASETAGIVAAFGPPGRERIFKTYYSSCCGGATQSVAEAFEEPAIAPFTPKSVGRRCDISAGRYKARFEWSTIVVGRDELARRFKLYGKSQDNPIQDLVGIRKIEIAKQNVAGRPVAFAVEDNRGARFMLGSEQFRLACNWDAPDSAKLPSSFVTPVLAGTNVRFEGGRGFGHGVGLCQWCIEAQARQGLGHEAIVQDAYPGAVLLKGY